MRDTEVQREGTPVHPAFLPDLRLCAGWLCALLRVGCNIHEGPSQCKGPCLQRRTQPLVLGEPAHLLRLSHLGHWTWASSLAAPGGSSSLLLAPLVLAGPPGPSGPSPPSTASPAPADLRRVVEVWQTGHLEVLAREEWVDSAFARALGKRAGHSLESIQPLSYFLSGSSARMLLLLLLNHFLFTACLLPPPSSKAAASSPARTPRMDAWVPGQMRPDGCYLGGG